METYCDGRASQHLLVSKARVAPKHLFIPRLKLVGAQTLAKLVGNMIKAFHSCSIKDKILWTDSMAVLNSTNCALELGGTCPQTKIKVILDRVGLFLQTWKNSSKRGRHGCVNRPSGHKKLMLHLRGKH